MNTIWLLALLMVSPSRCYQDEVLAAFRAVDAARLRELYAAAPTRLDSLMTRYRLFPLSENRDLLEDLPKSIANAGARELAALSALWAYRMQRSGFTARLTMGPRIVDLIDSAVEADASDPFVRLVAGQHHLNRPAYVGGRVALALDHFHAARELLERVPACGGDRDEIDVWTWLTLKRIDGERAAELFAQLRSRTLPPVFQAMTTTN